jgi:hypothetical protein
LIALISSELKGSSRIIIFGFFIKIKDNINFCFIPPDKLEKVLLSKVLILKISLSTVLGFKVLLIDR